MTLSSGAYVGFLHPHVAFAVLFLLIYVIRWVLLLLNRDAVHEKFKAIIKWPDRVISVGFLVTGVILALNTGNIAGAWLWVKLGAVVVSIPLAVIGFKRKNKALATLSIVCLVYAYGISETKSPNMKKESFYDAVAGRWGGPDKAKLAKYNANDNAYDVLDHGQQVYLRYCVNCHGPNGDRQGSGSAVLAASKLNREQIHKLLNEGKKAMPSYQKLLTEDEKNAVSSYVYAQLGAGKGNAARANLIP